MFYGVLNKPSGLTAEELLHYLEYVVAHGDGGSIVYASSTPVTMISCEENSVLMETAHNDSQKCKHDWVYIGLDEYRCNKCGARGYA